MTRSASSERGRMSHTKGFGVLCLGRQYVATVRGGRGKHAPEDRVLELDLGLDDLPALVDGLADVQRREHARHEQPRGGLDQVEARAPPALICQ